MDLAVDRTTASSLAVQRDEDGKPIKKMVGKDRRNLYLKNEGRVSSSADGAGAASAGAKHGGVWEDLPPADRSKRERAFADKSTKQLSRLRYAPGPPLFDGDPQCPTGAGKRRGIPPTARCRRARRRPDMKQAHRLLTHRTL